VPGICGTVKRTRALVRSTFTFHSTFSLFPIEFSWDFDISGDSGGGLFSRQSSLEPKNFELIGVASFGVRCGEIGLPGVYVNIFSKITTNGRG